MLYITDDFNHLDKYDTFILWSFTMSVVSCWYWKSMINVTGQSLNVKLEDLWSQSSWSSSYDIKHLSYLLALSLVRALSPAWTGSPVRGIYVSRTISPQQKNCLLSSVAIFVYNRSAISVNRRGVSYQFVSSFSRLFIQEYETDCCLRNRTDNNTN